MLKLSALVQPRGPLHVFDEWTEDDEDIDNGRRVALKALQAQSGSDTNGTATPTSSNPTSSATPDLANLSLNTSQKVSTNGSGKIDLSSENRTPRTANSSSPNMGSFVTKGDGVEADGEIDPARKLTRKSTTSYESENAKWYKAAKRAEKKSGAPNVHLAL